VSVIDVSIVLPVRNSQATLEICLDALLAQRDVAMEIIAVDGGSTDDSAAILDAAAARDPRLRVLHEQNRGVWAARNTAIAASQGRYIGACDADDIPQPGLYAALLARAESTGADMVVTPYRRIEIETGRVLAVEMTARSGAFVPADDPRGFACINTALWNKLIRGDALREVVAAFNGDGLRFATNPRLMEDMLVLAACLPWLGNVEFLDEPLYDYMVRRDATMTTVRLDELGALTDNLRTVRAWVAERGDGAKLQPVVDVLAFVHLGVSALINLVQTSPSEASQYAKDLRVTLAADFPGYVGNSRDRDFGPTASARRRLAGALMLFRCHALVPGLKVMGRLGGQGRW